MYAGYVAPVWKLACYILRTISFKIIQGQKIGNILEPAVLEVCWDICAR